MRSEHGDDVGDLVQAEHDHLVENLSAEHGGRVVGTTGDGVLAVLSAACDAASSAVEIEDRFRTFVHRYRAAERRSKTRL